MRISGLINKAEVRKFPAFDPKTGVPDPGYIANLMITDMDSGETVQCSIDQGYGVERLREVRKFRLPEAERDAIAAEVQAQIKPLEGQQLTLVVGKPRAKGFVTFPILSM